MRDTRVHFDLGARGRGLCSEWTRAGLAGGPPGVTDAARPGCQNRRFRGVTKHSPLCESEPLPSWRTSSAWLGASSASHTWRGCG